MEMLAMDGSSKRKQIKPCRGDLFEFAAGDGRYGYGLIVIPGDVFYAIFFRSLHNLRPEAASLAADEIALVGATTDSHFYNGQWTIIARDQPLPEKIPFPNWKVHMGGEIRTVDFESTNSWPMRIDEIDLLDFQFSRSPVGYEEALEAINGIREWDDSFNKLTVTYAMRRETRPRTLLPTSVRGK